MSEKKTEEKRGGKRTPANEIMEGGFLIVKPKKHNSFQKKPGRGCGVEAMPCGNQRSRD